MIRESERQKGGDRERDVWEGERVKEGETKRERVGGWKGGM